jgi:hypothetical protein
MPRDGAIIFPDLIGKLDVLRVECPENTGARAESTGFRLLRDNWRPAAEPLHRRRTSRRLVFEIPGCPTLTSFCDLHVRRRSSRGQGHNTSGWET